MRIYRLCFHFFIFTFAVLLYPFTPVALYKTQPDPLSISETQKKSVLFQPGIPNKEVIKKESNMAIHHLNQRQFGASDYEKTQRELQLFNRPNIGIVGKDSDWISYQEYQKKILGSSY